MDQKKNDIVVKIEDCDFSQKVKNKLIDFGIISLLDLIKLNSKELKSIKGLGSLGYAEIVIFLKKNNLSLKPIQRVADPFLNLKKMLITRLLKQNQPINWPRELKVASTLLKQKPDEKFWSDFNLPFKLNSLSFLLTERGREYLFQKKVEKHDLPSFKPEKIELNSEKIGEDVVNHKPKSIKDFLNGR